MNAEEFLWIKQIADYVSEIMLDLSTFIFILTEI